MFRNKIVFRSISVILILEILTSVVAPSVTWALTAGPTAPEATSFEPVDTTDVVDLKTGDFMYNIPLIEVPGPAGSYPLSLSYHAGIQPDQEASWVGLGFTLNPGSISRLVNGYPDDHENVTNVDRSFWEGGETTTESVGLSYGIANVASVSADLVFAQDTYRGKGVGFYMGIGVGLGGKTGGLGLGLNQSYGISPYGEISSSMGVNAGVNIGSSQSLHLSSNIGLSINSAGQLNMGASTGVDVGRTSLLGASISSQSSSPSLSIGGGVSSVFNGKSDNVSRYSESFRVEIPIPYTGINLRLGRDYQRYWIDESVGIHTFGSVYLADVLPNFFNAFDTYDLLDNTIDVAEHSDPEKVLGGSFPDVDFYSVTGQGVSGNIRPHHFQQFLYRQDKQVTRKNSNGDDELRTLSKSYILNSTPVDKPVEFRFVNDFSNKYEYDPINFQLSSNELSYSFSGSPSTGKNGNDGFNDNHLAGSKHVEWYSNQEILRAVPGKNPFSEGFIDCVSNGFSRNSDRQIGGFSITNASGITYHYSLPVYSFNELSKSVNSSTKQIKDGLSFNTLTKPERYAHSWLLTAVTGPDFVDKNENGLADHGDWGYWVNFEYEKWHNDYRWRNPGQGNNKDIDGEFENFSSGQKEIYYVSRIVTETHVAIFSVTERKDGREVTSLTDGGFEPLARTGKSQEGIQCANDCNTTYCSGGNCDDQALSACINNCNSQYPDVLLGYDFPKGMARLNNMKLYSYSDVVGNRLSDEFVLRSIDFSYDYSLATGTPNSYDANNFAVKLGKLTLKKIDFFGKKKISLIPPIAFEYRNFPYEKDKRDIWGFYKSDFDPSDLSSTNEIIARLPNAISGESVDAWSLTKINTSLGASIIIDYESDRYDESILSKRHILRVEEVAENAPNELKLKFWEKDILLSDYFIQNENTDIDLIGAYSRALANGYRSTCTDGGWSELSPAPFSSLFPKSFSGNVIVKEINNSENYIIVSGSSLYSSLKNETKVFTQKFKDYPYGKCPRGVIKDYYWEFSFSGERAWPHYFPAGIVSSNKNVTKFGGGLRVGSIKITNSQGDGRITSYEYDQGVTSYEPIEILTPKIHPDYPAEPRMSMKLYKQSVLKRLYSQIVNARLIPGPGVTYKTVAVRESNITTDGAVQNIPNHTVYEFQAYEKGMIDMLRSPVISVDGIAGNQGNVQYSRRHTNTVYLKDYSSRVGSLKTVTLYNSNTGTPVSKTINHYLHDDLDGSFDQNTSVYESRLRDNFRNQGLVEESFTRSRIMLYDIPEKIPYPVGTQTEFESEKRILLATISKMEMFPSIQTGQTNINYKTGGSSKTENLAFDFYSGQPTEVLTTDSYGNRYKSVAVPAYQHYPSMGLKVENKTNKQMLTQVAEQYSFVVNAQKAPIGLLSASVQTWSDKVNVIDVVSQPTIWRKQSSYQWIGTQRLQADGSYPYTDFSAHPFDWSGASNNDNWRKNSELTLYNTNSNGLEMKDLNGNFAATRMDRNNNKVIASAALANYEEMASASAEFYPGNTDKEGGVSRGAGNASRARAHTGEFSLLVGAGDIGFNYTLKANATDLTKKYRASVWVYAPGTSETQSDLNNLILYYSINGQEMGATTPKLQKNKSKSWYQLNIDITPNGSNDITIGVKNNSARGVYFDDFRVHPLNGSLTSYVYDSFSGELTYILDANNFYTKFEYDAMGRLIRTSKELLNFDFGDGKESFRADQVLKETTYRYGKSN
jgi:hypothetical protein